MNEPARDSTGRAPDAGGFALFLGVAALLGVFLVAGIRVRPPERGADPAMEEAALATLAATRVGDAPRPVGSEAHATTRDRIVERFRELGYEPQVEPTWVVAPSTHQAARVENIVARLPGSPAGPSVHVVAHYDSVPAGPGAADDGFGVAAVLETARALRDEGATFRHGVTFLVTDGEEAGLLGARAYVEQRGADAILAVVNLEARGTDGAALLFETGPGNAWTIDAWSAAAARPLTGSFFSAVYRALGHGTDLTVFRREGVPGVNFACVGGVQRYHTPLDSSEHADVRTYLHLRENAIAAARAFASAERPAGEPRDAVWFDVLGAFVVLWPIGWTAPIAWIAAALVLASVVVTVRRREASVARALGGVVAGVVALVAALAAVWAVGEALQLAGALPRQFVASTGGAVAAAGGAAVAATALVATLVRRRLGARSVQAGVAVVFAAGGVVAASLFPEGSHLMVVPAFATGAVAIVRLVRPAAGHLSESFAMLVAASVLWLPVSILLVDAVGVGPFPRAGGALLAVGAPLAVVATTLAPLVAGAARGWIVAGGGLVVAAVGFVVQVSAPVATSALPFPVNVVHAQEEGDPHAHWQLWPARGIPAEMRAGAEFDAEAAQVHPSSVDRVLATPAPATPLRAPAILGLRARTADAGRRVAFRLASQRGAAVTVLAIAADTRLRRISVEGVPVLPASLRDGSKASYVLYLLTTPPEGVAIELDVASESPVEAIVEDVTWGLPPGVAGPAGLRPAWCAPVHWGDRTVVRRRVRL